MHNLLNQRYQLTDPVGSGGMSVVWRATDTRLDRVVAVKIPHPGLSTDEGFRRRFEAEARSVAALQAPGVVNVFDYGHDQATDGTVMSYIVMEFVQGVSLLKRLADGGRLDPGDAVRIIAEAADALHEAHQASIIHRDVKPANILIRDKDGAVKLVDFGIALALDDTANTGTLLGTTSYVSPEQLTGRPVSPASDVYSLAVVAYECLAGRRPFIGDVPANVVAGHLYQPPPPLPDDVPNALATVVTRALGKSPASRWPDAASFAEALRGTGLGRAATAPVVRSAVDPNPGVDTAPVSAHDEPTMVTARPGRERRRFTIAVGTAAVVILAGSVLLWAPWSAPESAALVPGAVSESPSTQPSPSGQSLSPSPSESSPSPTPETPSEPPEQPAPKASLPWVMGFSEADARAELEKQGFTNVSVSYWDNSGDYACSVNEQAPWPFQDLPTDTPVSLQVQLTVSADSCDPLGG
ncbi:serine/threonine-protein kinase [Stackebrandtia soli]|uniref:serine/threonine-protein kinase n=1 Tax=Stackebrandtia soli TaxID=1892856 RepID=UPI0039EAB6DA